MRSDPRRHDTDSRVEWTGEAHLVGVSCDECGTAFAVAEDVAASDDPLTCEECEHDCMGHLASRPDDPALPPHIALYECEVCGEWWEFDTETGTHEVAE